MVGPGPIDPRESRPEASSAASLAASLILFIVVGAAAALFLWHGLNEILEGRSPPASVWWVVLAAAAVLMFLSVRLARRLGIVERDRS